MQRAGKGGILIYKNVFARVITGRNECSCFGIKIEVSAQRFFPAQAQVNRQPFEIGFAAAYWHMIDAGINHNRMRINDPAHKQAKSGGAIKVPAFFCFAIAYNVFFITNGKQPESHPGIIGIIDALRGSGYIFSGGRYCIIKFSIAEIRKRHLDAFFWSNVKIGIDSMANSPVLLFFLKIAL